MFSYVYTVYMCLYTTYVFVYVSFMHAVTVHCRSDLTVSYLTSPGGPDFEKAKQFIKGQFLSIGQPSEHKRLYPHFTIATDTENIRRVFDDVKDIILHFHLAEFGLV